MEAKANSIHAITCFYNPGMYARRAKNYFRFIQEIQRQGVPCLTIECAFGEQEYQLPECESTIRIRTEDIMWLKERLINTGLRNIPANYSAIAWLDCDIIFNDDLWAVKALASLDTYTIVQPFTIVHRSERDGPIQYESFGSKCMKDSSSSKSNCLMSHGHTGFAWVADRRLLDKHGLYDLCLTGSGDHLMAHAFKGEFNCHCVDERIQVGTVHWNHFRNWGESVYTDINGKIGAIPGSITHLWHGSIRNRAYSRRNQEFRNFQFDPESDVFLCETGVWHWNTDKPDLHDWARCYYVGRNEDG